MSTILIVGSSGNIGTPLVDELVAAGRKVRAATRSAGGHAVEVLVDLFATARSGAISDVSDDVEKLTGRAPRSVLQYAQDHREASLS